MAGYYSLAQVRNDKELQARCLHHSATLQLLSQVRPQRSSLRAAEPREHLEAHGAMLCISDYVNYK